MQRPISAANVRRVLNVFSNTADFELARRMAAWGAVKAAVNGCALRKAKANQLAAQMIQGHLRPQKNEMK